MTVDLDKRIETASVSLTKMAQSAGTDLGEVVAQVSAAIDFSGSMVQLYHSGAVQEAVERALALSLTGLDDDGIVPVYFYDSQVYDVIEATKTNYQGLVDDFAARHAMAGTAYAPPIEKLLGGAKKKHFGKNEADDPGQPPHLHLFFTDGAPMDDKRKIEKLLIDARTRPHFFQFIMLGKDPQAIDYLQHLNNDLQGDGVDNVGVTIYNNPNSLTDEKFFDDIVSEFFPVWLPKARAAGITKL